MRLKNLILIIKNIALNKLVFFHGIKSFCLDIQFKKNRKSFFLKKINEYLKKKK